MKSISIDDDFKTWGLERAWGYDLEDWGISLLFHLGFKWQDFSAQIQLGPFWARIGFYVWLKPQKNCSWCGCPLIGSAICPQCNPDLAEAYESDDDGCVCGCGDGYGDE